MSFSILKNTDTLTKIAVVAGLLYCTWPLGYVLNPAASQGLSSDLSAAGQPYSLFFVTADILSGLTAVVVSGLLLKRLATRRRSHLLRTAVAGLAVFGLLTMLDAMLPIGCVPTTMHQCSPIFADPLSFTHGVVSVGSIFGSTMTLVAMWTFFMRNKPRFPSLKILHLAMLLWFGFGLGTGALIVAEQPTAIAQHTFIVLESVLTGVTPYLVLRGLSLQPAKR